MCCAVLCCNDVLGISKQTFEQLFNPAVDVDEIRSHPRIRMKKVLSVPLKGSRLLRRLGSLTVLCYLDERVVLSSLPSLEEILLPKGDSSNVLLKLSRAKNSGAKFEGSNWMAQLPALKPLALACMIGTSLHEQKKQSTQTTPNTTFKLKECMQSVRNKYIILSRNPNYSSNKHYQSALSPTT